MDDLANTTILLDPLRPAPEGRILRMKLSRFVDTLSAFRQSRMVTTGTSSMDYQESKGHENIHEQEQQTDPIPEPPVIVTENRSSQTDASISPRVSNTTQHPRVPSGIVLPLQRTAAVVPCGAVSSSSNSDSTKQRLDGDQNSMSNKEAVTVLSEHLDRLKNFIGIISRHYGSEMNQFIMRYIEDVSKLAFDLSKKSDHRRRVIEEFQIKIATQFANNRLWGCGLTPYARAPPSSLRCSKPPEKGYPKRPNRNNKYSQHRHNTELYRCDVSDSRTYNQGSESRDRHAAGRSSPTRARPLSKRLRSKSPPDRLMKLRTAPVRSNNDKSSRRHRSYWERSSFERQRSRSNHHSDSESGNNKPNITSYDDAKSRHSRVDFPSKDGPAYPISRVVSDCEAESTARIVVDSVANEERRDSDCESMKTIDQYEDDELTIDEILSEETENKAYANDNTKNREEMVTSKFGDDRENSRLRKSSGTDFRVNKWSDHSEREVSSKTNHEYQQETDRIVFRTDNREFQSIATHITTRNGMSGSDEFFDWQQDYHHGADDRDRRVNTSEHFYDSR